MVGIDSIDKEICLIYKWYRVNHFTNEQVNHITIEQVNHFANEQVNHITFEQVNHFANVYM